MRHLPVILVAIGVVDMANGQSKMPPRFEDFPVPVIYRGVVRPPDFGNRSRFDGTDLRCFGSPADYADAHVNFAGHYVMSSCTCGSGCHSLYMWDAVSGKFYQRAPPGAINVGPYPGRNGAAPWITYKGEQFQISSKLLIVEGCVEDTCDCKARYYKWSGSRFDEVFQRSLPLPEKCNK